jgi:hypothetical protein
MFHVGTTISFNVSHICDAEFMPLGIRISNDLREKTRFALVQSWSAFSERENSLLQMLPKTVKGGAQASRQVNATPSVRRA